MQLILKARTKCSLSWLGMASLRRPSPSAQWRFGGRYVRSGLFGVSQAKKRLLKRRSGKYGVPQRLIINLVPANSLHADAVLGENDLMPSEAQFNNVHLRPLQLLLMSARDRRCFFYIFSLPGPWTSIFALCEEVDASVFTPGALGKVPVGVRVCAMGWRYATALCQAAHRRMLLAGHRLPCTLSDPCGESSLCEARELRRDRPCPINGCKHAVAMWSVYIDNLDLYEVVEAEAVQGLINTVAPSMSGAERCYAVWNSPGSPEDAVDRQLEAQSLGVRTDGTVGRRDVPAEYFPPLISLIFHMVTSERVRKRDLQVTCGRLLRCVLRNRATSICLDQV